MSTVLGSKGQGGEAGKQQKKRRRRGGKKKLKRQDGGRLRTQSGSLICLATSRPLSTTCPSPCPWRSQRSDGSLDITAPARLVAWPSQSGHPAAANTCCAAGTKGGQHVQKRATGHRACVSEPPDWKW